MANYSVLLGCPGPQAITSEALGSEIETWSDDGPIYRAGWGPRLTGKYCVPVFWLSLFEPNDRHDITSRRDNLDGTYEEIKEPIWCSEKSLAISRLSERLSTLIALTPDALHESYEALGRDFAGYLSAHFKHSIALDLRDIFAMGTEPSEVSALLSAISGGADAARLRELPELSQFSCVPTFSWTDARDPRPPHPDLWRAELFGFAGDAPEWPPRPSSAEYDFAWFLEPPIASRPPPAPTDARKGTGLGRWFK